MKITCEQKKLYDLYNGIIHVILNSNINNWYIFSFCMFLDEISDMKRHKSVNEETTTQ